MFSISIPENLSLSFLLTLTVAYVCLRSYTKILKKRFRGKKNNLVFAGYITTKEVTFSGIQATGTIDRSMFNGDYRCFPHVDAAAAPLQMLEKRCISKFLIEKR